MNKAFVYVTANGPQVVLLQGYVFRGRFYGTRCRAQRPPEPIDMPLSEYIAAVTHSHETVGQAIPVNTKG